MSLISCSSLSPLALTFQEMYAEPLYHTLYETFALVDELYDVGFNFHAALAKLWAILAVDIADAQVI